MKCLAVLVALTLAACDQPLVSPKPLVLQGSESNVADWNRVGERIARAMQRVGYLPSAYNGHPHAQLWPAQPWRVVLAKPDSLFLRMVADSLRAAILDAGGSVEDEAGSGQDILLDVDVVAWGGASTGGNRAGSWAETPNGPDLLRQEVELKAAVQSGHRIDRLFREALYVSAFDLPAYAPVAAAPIMPLVLTP